MEIIECAVVQDVVVCHGDGAALFDFFDFGDVASLSLLFGEGSFGSVHQARVAELTGRNDGDYGEGAGEVVFEVAKFAPSVESVKEDALLSGGDEVVGILSSKPGEEVIAEFCAELGAPDLLVLGGFLLAAFVHLAIKHAAEIDVGYAAFFDKLDGFAFARAGHTDDGNDFRVHRYSITYDRCHARGGWVMV